LKTLRIDDLLVNKGLALDLGEARKQILLGNVLKEGHKFSKSNEKVLETERIWLKNAPKQFVSRGGEKLASVLAKIDLVVKNKSVLDVGASTGGFTDCILKKEAKSVIAVDVASGFLDHSLVVDERVLNIEKCNLRVTNLGDLKDLLGKAQQKQSRGQFDFPVDLIIGDVSFISWRKIIPNLIPMLKSDGHMLLLFKPQFEVAKDQVPPGGIIKDDTVIQSELESFTQFLEGQNLKVQGLYPSAVKGTKGNQEYFIYI
jgi:23S rRNA (cytidine1920-2'-O)/16S rRNA (cytidine1409-2'-O)-methyltransferase